MEGTKKFHVFRYDWNLELSITMPCFYFVIIIYYIVHLNAGHRFIFKSKQFNLVLR